MQPSTGYIIIILTVRSNKGIVVLAGVVYTDCILALLTFELRPGPTAIRPTWKTTEAIRRVFMVISD